MNNSRIEQIEVVPGRTACVNLLTPRDVAEVLNVSLRMFWRLVANGELQTVKVGRLTRVTKMELAKFVEYGGSKRVKR